jgi:hypothetical protein
MLLDGDVIHECHPALRWILLCEATKWAHLPRQGAWGDQDPDFVKWVKVYSFMKSERDAKEGAKRK